MTSLILIANKESTMMVGDTAVTFYGKKSVKGVHKVFELSNSPSMGIMVFGNSRIGDVPLQTLIEKFRKETDFSNLGTVGSVKKQFLNFMAENTENQSLDDYVLAHEETFRKSFKLRLNGLSRMDFDIFMKNQDKCEIFPFLLKYDLDFTDIIDEFVDGEDLAYYNNVVIKIFSKNLLQYSTGVVIAGYNKNSQLPSFTQFHMFINDCGKMIFETVMSRNNFSDVVLIPFAMNKEIKKYLTGIDSDIEFFIQNSVRYLLYENYDELYDYFKNKPYYSGDDLRNIQNDMGEFRNTLEYSIRTFMNNLNELKKCNENLVLNVIDNFPINELIALAEFFINITSAKYRFSFDPQYVGGDVDIAILKPDEFVWAKYGGNIE